MLEGDAYLSVQVVSAVEYFRTPCEPTTGNTLVVRLLYRRDLVRLDRQAAAWTRALTVPNQACNVAV